MLRNSAYSFNSEYYKIKGLVTCTIIDFCRGLHTFWGGVAR